MNKFSAPFKVKVSKTWKDKKNKTEILPYSLVGMLVHRSFGPLAPDPAVFGFTELFHGTYLYSLVESVACLARENYPWLSINRLSSSSFIPKTRDHFINPEKKCHCLFKKPRGLIFMRTTKIPLQL